MGAGCIIVGLIILGVVAAGMFYIISLFTWDDEEMKKEY
jgi:hypothetical protein